jgi:xylulokinase
MSFMGVDVGQTGCKVLAFDAEGRPIASAYREYPAIVTQPGWAELDSGEVLAHCKDAISEVAMATRGSDPVQAIAVASMGESFTVVGPRDEFLCHGMIASDTRARRQVEEITDSIGLDTLYRTTGHSPHTMFTLFKLAWLRDNRPAILDRASKILCYEDLVGYALTGEAVVDYSIAARTMLFDVTRRHWAPRLLDCVGLTPDVLPRPEPAGTMIGVVRPDTADELGLARDVRVVAGGHDQPCGALGAGVVGEGTAMYATGTAECVSPAFDRLLLNDTLRDANLATYHHVVPGLYFTVAFNITGGNLLRWFRDEFGHHEVQLARRTGCNAYDLLLESIPSTPTSVLVLPHFTATGTPYFDTNPTSAVLGLTLSSTRGDLIRSLLEGVTYEMRLNVDILRAAGVPISELRAIGGGAKSAAWMQIKADIMDIPIVSMDVSEAAGLGAALLAALGSGALDSVEDGVNSWVRPARVFEPEVEGARAYRERYDVYRDLYRALKPLGTRMAKWAC